MARRQSVTAARGSTGPPKGCLAAFFSVFSLFGLGFAVFGFVVPAFRILAARSWVETPCTILASDLLRHIDSEGTTYSVSVRFAYAFEGREYESARYKLSSSSSGGRRSKQAVVDALPVGAAALCFVNPGDPAEAVIERGFTDEWVFGAAGLGFALVGPLFYLLLTRQRGPRRDGRARRPRGERQDMDVPKATASTFAMREQPDADGGIELLSGTRRIGKTIGLAVFALIWNGIVSVFLVKDVLEGRGMGRVAMSLFAVPFVLVGVGVVLVLAHQILSFFTPRPTIGLHHRRLEPGARVDLSWRLRGAVGSIRRFTVALEQREVCTYSRGTKTVTDQTVVRRIEVFATEGQSRLERGDSEVEVPADAMPSFEAESNAIQWVLVVTAEIPLWPDRKDEYLLWVHPREEATA